MCQFGFRLLRSAATVGQGWGHGTVAISAPRPLRTRAYRFPGYPLHNPAGPPAVRGWILSPRRGIFEEQPALPE